MFVAPEAAHPGGSMEELYQRAWTHAFASKMTHILDAHVDVEHVKEHAEAVARAAVMSFDHAKMTEAIIATNKEKA